MSCRYDRACSLVLFLVVNAAADISLDYYLGNEVPLRTAGQILLEGCGPVVFRYRCFNKCGQNHACFSGHCFCIRYNVSTGEDLDNGSSEVSSREEETLEILPQSGESPEELSRSVKSIPKQNVGGDTFYDYEEDEPEPPSYVDNIKEELFDRPALRHHIAHFCPDLDIARDCIRKCMSLGLPAFCGKDHNCYCSHKYEKVVDDPKGDPTAIRNAFRDLYQKYFGPQ